MRSCSAAFYEGKVGQTGDHHITMAAGIWRLIGWTMIKCQNRNGLPPRKLPFWPVRQNMALAGFTCIMEKNLSEHMME